METALLTDQAKDGRGAGQDGDDVEDGGSKMRTVRGQQKECGMPRVGTPVCGVPFVCRPRQMR